MSIETKLGVVLGLVVVVMFAVINAAPARRSMSEPTQIGNGTPTRINWNASD